MKLLDWHVFYQLGLFFEYLLPVPTIDVEMTAAEAQDDGVTSKPCEKTTLLDPKRPGYIQCYDPATKQRLGEVTAMTAKDVHELCVKAAQAQKSWVRTSYKERRKVLRTIQKYIVNHVEDICRVCTRDSGKPEVDALLGEVVTTCEKIRTINSNGELWLRPSYRPPGPMMMHKWACVEYVPLGVLGVIAPWNYPVSGSTWTVL
jgi:acyl-CoA reductase-like NAD-dependent aldehyde dehydrogenase